MSRQPFPAILFDTSTLVFMGSAFTSVDDQAGNRLLSAARELHKKARSQGDLKKASEAYLFTG
jgi:hypothetical protein